MRSLNARDQVGSCYVFGDAPLVPQDDVRGLLRCYEFDAFVSQSPQVNPFEQPFSSAEQDGCDSNVQFINEAFAKILLDGVRPTADAHVHSAGRLACPFKRVANAARDEMEHRVAFHLDGWTCMMRHDEDRNVIRWIVSPPAFPVHVRPGPTKGAEHVPPENPSPNILKATSGEVIVNPGRAVVLPEQGPLERACWK